MSSLKGFSINPPYNPYILDNNKLLRWFNLSLGNCELWCTLTIKAIMERYSLMVQVEFYWNCSFVCLHPQLNCSILRDGMLSCSSSYPKCQLLAFNKYLNWIRFSISLGILHQLWKQNSIYIWMQTICELLCKSEYVPIIFCKVFFEIYKIIKLIYHP